MPLSDSNGRGSDRAPSRYSIAYRRARISQKPIHSVEPPIVQSIQSVRSGAQMTNGREKPRPGLIGPHGGYRGLKSYQNAEIVYDATVRFCERFVARYSRTTDQMVQAARSGKQNIAEGSMASGTSRKTELKLVGIARASLEELLLDYQDFLRQRGLALWESRAMPLPRPTRLSA